MEGTQMITHILLHIDCIAIMALGFWLGYMFVWGLVNLNVTATGFVTMATFIFTGPVLEMIGHLNCSHATAFYILTGVIGGLLYLILISLFKVKSPTKKDNQDKTSEVTPVFPWLNN